MKKLYILFSLSLGLLFFSSCSKDLKPQESTAEAKGLPQTFEATLEYFEGSVLVNGKTAELGMSLHENDVLESGDDSLAELVFYNKNIMRLQANTTVSLGLQASVIQVNLKQGSLGAVFKNLSKLESSDSLRINTPVSSAGVRGTSIYVQASPDETYICDCNGVITLYDKEGRISETLEASHHEGRIIRLMGDLPIIMDGGMRYHDDSFMEDLAKRIQYTIDWETVDRS